MDITDIFVIRRRCLFFIAKFFILEYIKCKIDDGSLLMKEDVMSKFVTFKDNKYMIQLQSILKSLKYYMKDDLSLEKVTTTGSFDGKYIGCQIMDGDQEIFFGISGDDEILLKIASVFARYEFDTFDEDAYDAICELINCVNGAMAVCLEDRDINCELKPPVFYCNISVSGRDSFCILDMKLKGLDFNIILAVDDGIIISR